MGEAYIIFQACLNHKALKNSKKKAKMADKKLGFAENFALSGVAAVVSKTAAAPIERIKLLVQNQDEMIRQGRLDKPYSGVIDCTARTIKNEGVYPLWRGNLANCLRYFPTQALNFAFKDKVKAMFNVPKDASYVKKFSANILSGGCAGSLPWIRHLLRRHFRLSWHVLRSLRFSEADLVGSRRRSVPVLLLGLRRHRYVRIDVLPHRHHSSSYDDDLRHRRQVQGLHRLRRSNPEERGLHVHDEGCRRQHSSRRRRRRCPRRFRRLQEALHRMAFGLSHLRDRDKFVGTHIDFVRLFVTNGCGRATWNDGVRGFQRQQKSSPTPFFQMSSSHDVQMKSFPR